MATATKSKAKVEEKEKKLFPRMDFHVEQLPGCCGIGVIANIKESEGVWHPGRNWNSNGRMSPAKKEFFTKEEQAEALYKEIVEKTNSGGWHGAFYSQLLISLVSSYDATFKPTKAGEHQYQELQEILLREGWTIYSVFINPNHGNEVTLFGKYFPERDKHPDDDEEDDGWDDDDYDDEEDDE